MPKTKKLAKMAAGAVLLTAMNGVTAANEIVADDSTIANFQLNGIQVVAKIGNETLVSPLGSLADQHQNMPLLGSKDALEVPFTAMTISREAADYFNRPDKGFVDMVTLSPAVRDDSKSTFNNFIDVRGVMLNGGSMYINGIPNMMGRTDQMFTADNFVNKVTVIAGPNIGIGGTPLAQYPGGGAIYFESKKAMATPNFDVTLSYKGNKSFEEALDYGKRFGKNNRYGVRVNISNIGGENNIKPENIRSRDFYIDLDQRTEHSWSNFMIGHTYAHTNGAAKHFRFANNLSAIPKAPKGNRSFVPEWTYAKAENMLITFNHEQKFSDAATAFVNLGRNVNHPYESVYTWGGRNLDADGNFTLEFNNRLAKTENSYAGVGVKGKFELGSTKHEYVINADRNWQKSYSTKDSWSLKNLVGNIYKENHWDKPAYTMGSLKLNSQMYTNAYHVMDSITMLDDKLNILLGYHNHETTVKNSSGEQKYSAGSPTIGINYKLTPKTSVYVSHSEDFAYGKTVGAGYANEGQALDPYKTKQNEIGFKYSNKELLHTLSYYTIKQANYGEYTDSKGDLYLKQIDDKENKGFEYSIAGKLTDKWEAIGGITRVDAKDVKTHQRISQVARWSGSLGLVYKPVENLALTARLQYLGDAPVQLNKTVTMPSHTLLHLGASYKTQMGKTPVTLRAQVYNVFDKKYWSPTEGRTQANVGDPRTFVMSATFHF